MVGVNLPIRVVTGLVLYLSLSVSPLDAQRIPGWGRVAPAGGHQNDPQLLRPAGGPVIPMFEGWYINQDGTYQLCFGYFNTNTEAVIEIPLGSNNIVEPSEFDGVQPTHFLPVPPGGRRHYCVMSVTVPDDWGDRDIVWTLRDRYGQEYSSPGRLLYETYHLEEPFQESRESSAPRVRVEGTDAESMGRTPVVVGPLNARVGAPLSLTALVRRDNPYVAEDRMPISVRWQKYQGPGDVIFRPISQHRAAGTRIVVEPATWLESPDAWGQLETEATFAEAGQYRLLLQAYNDPGRRTEPSDLEFFCCWTNVLVDVVVAPET